MVVRDLNLTDLQLFTVIAQQGSFTRAAAELNCSRSHLSKQLSLLESQLGVTLITRTTRAQRLTEQGELLLSQCQSAFKLIDQAVTEVVDNAQQLQGTITVNSVGGILGEEVVTPLINEFLKLHPNITIELDFSSQRVDLLADQFDLVFRMGALEDSGLVARKLINIENLLMASPQYLQQHGTPEHPKALKGHSCISGTVANWTCYPAHGAEKPVEVPVEGRFRCKNGRAMKQSALQGLGVVRLPRFYCSDELKQGKLQRVFQHWHLADTPIYLLYHKDRYQGAALTALINFIVSHFSDTLQARG